MSKDLFSKQASLYAKYRPGYPPSLIDYILAYVKNRDIAWDCATGNGQAAVLLAPYFKNVLATDISQNQISHAVQHPSIRYSVSTAEKTLFADDTFDLVTVAQAYHWLHFEQFSREATRVSKNGAVVAVWGYELVEAADPALNQGLRRFYSDIVGKYWDPERKYVDEQYKTIPFYFSELPSKTFRTGIQWTLDDFVGYLNTWSSVQHFIRENHYNPVNPFVDEIKKCWENKEEHLFSIPYFLRLGSIEK